MGTTIHQIERFEAEPEEIYEMLMNAQKHGEFTKSDCKISNEVGGEFSCYDGWITGKNVELVPGKKIVQEWRGKDWPEGHFSTVTFEIDEVSDDETEVDFKQEGIPEDFYDKIRDGWKTHYWDKIRDYILTHEKDE